MKTVTVNLPHIIKFGGAAWEKGRSTQSNNAGNAQRERATSVAARLLNPALNAEAADGASFLPRTSTLDLMETSHDRSHYRLWIT